MPALTLVSLAATLAMTMWQWHDHVSAIAGALRVDDLTLALTIVFVAAGAAAVILSWRAKAPRESAHGEYHSLLLASIAGMAILVAAQNLITLFIGIELLSIPLYVLCATEMRRASSLESGLKYLIIGSVGSATLSTGSRSSTARPAQPTSRRSPTRSRPVTPRTCCCSPASR